MSARTLRAEAHKACRFRWHNMTRFRRVGNSPIWWRSHCRECGMEVDVMLHPDPNQTDIAGAAVAENCTECAVWLRAAKLSIGPFKNAAAAEEFRRRVEIYASLSDYEPLGHYPVLLPGEYEEIYR